MAAESFNSTIAEHQELQITLRDDLARFGTVLCGESLTTHILLVARLKFGREESLSDETANWCQTSMCTISSV